MAHSTQADLDLTFRDWVRYSAVLKDNGLRNAILVMRADPNLPEIADATELRAYLEARSADPVALLMAPTIMSRFRQARRVRRLRPLSGRRMGRKLRGDPTVHQQLDGKVGPLLAQHRRRRGLTQPQVADALGMTAGHYGSIECRGARMSVGQLILAAKLLRVSLDDLAETVTR